MRLGSESSARRLVDLAANGALVGKGMNDGALAEDLGSLLRAYPDVRSHVYDLLKAGPATEGLVLLAHAVADSPDADGLLLLVRFENELKRSFMTWRTIEGVVTEHVPSDHWKDAYDVVPVPAVELRRELLAMTTDGGSTDAAARCLIEIDSIRDEHGVPESEPRHPDLGSGKPWPMLLPDPDAGGS
jgi:hypothetical protein